MDFGDERYMSLFFELHSGLPREGPGCEESTRKALGSCKGLPKECQVLDLGCGPGMQTVQLAKAMVSAEITGLDFHQPFLDQLTASAEGEGVLGRIKTICGDMGALDFAAESFDLIWSEGAAYIIGVDTALKQWAQYLKPNGYIALTDATWFLPDPPEPLREFWKAYPGMKDVEENLKMIKGLGYKIVESFPLPDSAWHDHYYKPMNESLSRFKAKYPDDEIALEISREGELEIEYHEKYSKYYGYTFFVLQRD